MEQSTFWTFISSRASHKVSPNCYRLLFGWFKLFKYLYFEPLHDLLQLQKKAFLLKITSTTIILIFWCCADRSSHLWCIIWHKYGFRAHLFWMIKNIEIDQLWHYMNLFLTSGYITMSVRLLCCWITVLTLISCKL